MKPSVSALIPNYNQGKFFASALSGLLKQTCLPNEIIVVDDKSTDDSVGLIEKELVRHRQEIKDKGVEVRLIKRETNGGLASCRNTGLEQIKSDIVALNDMDDIYYADKIKKSLEVFEKFPSASVCYSDYDVYEVKEQKQYREFKHPYDARLLFQACIVSTNSLVRRSLWQELGYYDIRYQISEDYCLWLKALKAKKLFMHIAEPLFCYRLHGGNITLNHADRMNQYIAQYKQEIFGDPNSTT